jgi:hypothetical protein
MKDRRYRLEFESLEDRSLPANFGVPWPGASHLTLSLVPDGMRANQEHVVKVEGVRADLFKAHGSGRATDPRITTTFRDPAGHTVLTPETGQGRAPVSATRFPGADSYAGTYSACGSSGGPVAPAHSYPPGGLARCPIGPSYTSPAHDDAGLQYIPPWYDASYPYGFFNSPYYY